jgi:hypothetical protein
MRGVAIRVSGRAAKAASSLWRRSTSAAVARPVATRVSAMPASVSKAVAFTSPDLPKRVRYHRVDIAEARLLEQPRQPRADMRVAAATARNRLVERDEAVVRLRGRIAEAPAIIDVLERSRPARRERGTGMRERAAGLGEMGEKKPHQHERCASGRPGVERARGAELDFAEPARDGLLACQRQLAPVEVEADHPAGGPCPPGQHEADLAAAAAGINNRCAGERLEPVEKLLRRRGTRGP